jgi:hypothetical protein
MPISAKPSSSAARSRKPEAQPPLLQHLVVPGAA